MTDDATATNAGHENRGSARTAGAGSSTMPGWTLPALYGAFVLSGAAGLTYELVWSRYLALLVGHSAYAQVLVIAVYLGGLAAGALAVGDRSRRLARPLLWYAGIEAVLAVAGLLYHPVFRATTELAYGTLFPALAGTGLLGPVKWGVAAALILPQSVLLGTTFPLMTAGTLRRVPERAGRTVALLYFANTIGGAAGLLLAGFGLIAWFAMPGTLVTAAVFNALAAAAAFTVARRTRGATEEWSPARARAAGVGAPVRAGGAALSRTALWRVLLTVSFGTAVASFIYEIGWIRMLSLVMGSATHAFELMLSAFILGLAVGALWIRRAADCHPDRAGDPVAAAEAGRRSAALNEARAALRDPERRADLLLSRLGGPSAAEEKSLPPAFLTEMMELRERVEEAVADADPAGCEEIEREISAERDDRIERVRELFVEAAEDSGRLREIRLELNVWRYHERLLAELRGTAGAR